METILEGFFDPADDKPGQDIKFTRTFKKVHLVFKTPFSLPAKILLHRRTLSFIDSHHVAED